MSKSYFKNNIIMHINNNYKLADLRHNLFIFVLLKIIFGAILFVCLKKNLLVYCKYNIVKKGNKLCIIE